MARGPNNNRPKRSGIPATQLGALAGVAAGLGYAFTVIFGSRLADAGLQSTTVLSIRFGISGLILCALSAARGKSVLPVRGERLGIFLLGAIGYMTESSLFFAGIARGSAAAVTLLFYVYPAIVTLIDSVTSRRLPSARVVGALVLSIVGCALVASAAGDIDLEGIAVVFALLSAVAFSLYVTVGARVSKQSDAMVTGAWVALGASASFTIRALLGAGYASTAGHWPELIANGAANALAFGMMFGALGLLGPSRATVVLTTEAVFTVILSVLILNESLAPEQLVGAVAVLVAAVVVAATKVGGEIVEA
ncbi:MAG: DMT family transporter, partial [Acidimicrobiales bacterium]|nr:DMT family transporter [Acidimicrobiales bacterium]